MPLKILTQKQTHAVARALRKQGGLPELGRCKMIRKVGKSKPFGVLPVGVDVEICRYISDGKGVVTASVMGSRKKRKMLSGPKRRRRK